MDNYQNQNPQGENTRQNYQQPYQQQQYQQQYQQPYQQPYQQGAAPMVPEYPQTLGQWMLTIFITYIPIVNLIMLFIWAFTKDTPKSKSNWAKASLIWTAVGIVLSIIFAGLITTAVGAFFALISGVGN